MPATLIMCGGLPAAGRLKPFTRTDVRLASKELSITNRRHRSHETKVLESQRGHHALPSVGLKDMPTEIRGLLMLRQAHFADDVLLDYAENRTDAQTTARVRDHLATGCEQCAADLSFWIRLLPAIDAGRTPAAPQPVLERAFTLFDRIEPKPTFVERLRAALVFDSRQQPLLAGARDIEQNSFKLLYEARGAHIDLLCERESDHWNIAGQVLSEVPSEFGWKVLASHPNGQTKTDTDTLGEFRLSGLTPGVYDLAVQAAGREIVLSNIVLQAP
jgi:hypothetical protein